MAADPKPSAWVMERARLVHGEMMEWFTGEAQLRVIAGALDAAREEATRSP